MKQDCHRCNPFCRTICGTIMLLGSCMYNVKYWPQVHTIYGHILCLPAASGIYIYGICGICGIYIYVAYMWHIYVAYTYAAFPPALLASCPCTIFLASGSPCIVPAWLTLQAGSDMDDICSNFYTATILGAEIVRSWQDLRKCYSYTKYVLWARLNFAQSTPFKFTILRTFIYATLNLVDIEKRKFVRKHWVQFRSAESARDESQTRPLSLLTRSLVHFQCLSPVQAINKPFKQFTFTFILSPAKKSPI